jgi:hypothetical protein
VRWVSTSSGEAAGGDLLGDVAEGEEADRGVDLERAGFGDGPHVLDGGERLADRPVSPQVGARSRTSPPTPSRVR